MISQKDVDIYRLTQALTNMHYGTDMSHRSWFHISLFRYYGELIRRCHTSLMFKKTKSLDAFRHPKCMEEFIALWTIGNTGINVKVRGTDGYVISFPEVKFFVDKNLNVNEIARWIFKDVMYLMDTEPAASAINTDIVIHFKNVDPTVITPSPVIIALKEALSDTKESSADRSISLDSDLFLSTKTKLKTAIDDILICNDPSIKYFNRGLVEVLKMFQPAR